MKLEPVTVFWFRRDLRIDDNHGLAKALDGSLTVLPIFIFDSDILDSLERDDSRVSFIHQAVTDLNKDLRSYGSRLHVFQGRPAEVFKRLRPSKMLLFHFPETAAWLKELMWREGRTDCPIVDAGMREMNAPGKEGPPP